MVLYINSVILIKIFRIQISIPPTVELKKKTLIYIIADFFLFIETLKYYYYCHFFLQVTMKKENLNCEYFY